MTDTRTNAEIIADAMSAQFGASREFYLQSQATPIVAALSAAGRLVTPDA